VELHDSDKEEGSVEYDPKPHTIERVPCLAHVIQLCVKDLYTALKVSPKNDNLVRIWDESIARKSIAKALRDELHSIPLLLAKVVLNVIRYN
jgi:hypothetical protein